MGKENELKYAIIEPLPGDAGLPEISRYISKSRFYEYARYT